MSQKSTDAASARDNPLIRMRPSHRQYHARCVRTVIRGADMPVLSGLRHILERATKRESEDVPLQRASPSPSVLWCEQACA